MLITLSSSFQPTPLSSPPPSLFLASTAFVFFFFFQAEDGIRDTSVTGVQTCALPIYRGLAPVRGAAIFEQPGADDPAAEILRHREQEQGRGHERADDPPGQRRAERSRSEERRVGKEWKSMRATGHRQKKQKKKIGEER